MPQCLRLSREFIVLGVLCWLYKSGGGKETVISALYHPVAFTFSFPHILCPTLSQKACRFVPLPHVLVRFIIKGGGTFWHLSIGECCWLFVRWKLNHVLRKTALQQLSPFMYCNVKAHYSSQSAPSDRLQSAQVYAPPTLTCSSIPFIYDVLPCVRLYQRFVFNVIDSVALNPQLKAVSPIICGASLTTTWLHHCSTTLRCTERIPSQGKCWCVNSLLKKLKALFFFSP